MASFMDIRIPTRASHLAAVDENAALARVRPSICLSRLAYTPSDSPGSSTENAAGGEMYRTCLMQADGLSGVVPHLGPAVADRQQSADEGTAACTSEAASPHLTGITTNRSGSSLLAAASGSGHSAAVGTTRTPNTSDLRGLSSVILAVLRLSAAELPVSVAVYPSAPRP